MVQELIKLSVHRPVDVYKLYSSYFKDESIPKINLTSSKDPSIWKEAGEAGLLCIDTPAEYGGIGADFAYCTVAHEEQFYAGPDFFGPGFGLHTSIAKGL